MTKFNVEIVTEKPAATIVTHARIFPNVFIRNSVKLSRLPYRKFHASEKTTLILIHNRLIDNNLCQNHVLFID